MIEAGEQDKFLKAVSAIVEKQPSEAAPLELMVDFCRYTSNSRHVPLALSQLADLCTATGNYSRAEECLQELIDRRRTTTFLAHGSDRLSQRRHRLAPHRFGTDASPRNRQFRTKPAARCTLRRSGKALARVPSARIQKKRSFISPLPCKR